MTLIFSDTTVITSNVTVWIPVLMYVYKKI